MSKILAIAWKDLRSTSRNVPALAMMLLAPLALAALLGFAFGGGGGFDIAATKVAVANLDKGGAGAGQSAGAAVAGILRQHGPQGRARDSTRSSARRGPRRPSTTARRRWPSSSRPTSATSCTAAIPARDQQRRAVREPDAARSAASIVEGVVGQVLLDFNGARAAAAGAVAAALTQGDPPAGRARRRAPPSSSPTPAASPPACGSASARPGPARREKEVSVTGAILAGMMVFFMFFGAANVARTILDEDRDGHAAAPVHDADAPRRDPRRQVRLASSSRCSLQAVVLLVAGRLIFGIHWGRLDAVVLLTLVAAGVAGGLALLVISFAQTPAQAGAIGAGVYLVLALLGGNFTGTSQTSGVFGVVQKFTPNGWLIEGWDTTMRGGGALRHPLAAAGAAGLRGGLLLLRGAAYAAAVRVRLVNRLVTRPQGPAADGARQAVVHLHPGDAAGLHALLRAALRRRQQHGPAAAGGVTTRTAARRRRSSSPRSASPTVVKRDDQAAATSAEKAVDGGRARRRRPAHPPGLQRRCRHRGEGRSHDRLHRRARAAPRPPPARCARWPASR